MTRTTGGERILIVEDNRNVALGIRRALETEGYEVVHVIRGDEAARRLSRERFELVLLDLMLPGASGFDVLRGLREDDDATPVLVLSARGEEVDRIQGFRLGADDYVVKPVGVLELLFRVQAILRRTGRPPTSEPAEYRFGDIEVDEGARTVKRRGEPVELSRLEFDLLASLLRADGNAVSRDRLLREVWGIARPDRVRTRTIDTHISALRPSSRTSRVVPGISSPCGRSGIAWRVRQRPIGERGMPIQDGGEARRVYRIYAEGSDSRNRSMAGVTMPGRSSADKWPAPSTSRNSAPGIAFAIRIDRSGGSVASSSPTITRVGERTSPRRSIRSRRPAIPPIMFRTDGTSTSAKRDRHSSTSLARSRRVVDPNMRRRTRGSTGWIPNVAATRDISA